MDLSQATREIMWNINGAWLMYTLFLVALGVFVYGVYLRVQSWREGKEDNERFGDIKKRIWILIKETLFQRSTLRNPFPGSFHAFIFYSFAVLVVTTTVVALDYDLGTHFFEGWLYLFLSIGSEVGGLLVIVGVFMAMYRRLVIKKETLRSALSDTLVLWFLFAVILTGFLAEGIRISFEPTDKFASLSFVGYALSFPAKALGQPAALATHKVLWWVHLSLAFGWIASIPFTKFSHIVFLPANVFFSKLKPRGELTRIDLMELMESEDFDEENFNVGVQTSADLTWKQRLDLDACIHCGRCDELCPSRRAGDEFAPETLIFNLAKLVEENTRILADSKGKDGEVELKQVIGDAFQENFPWYCRTCGACIEICPAMIQHVDVFFEIRRNETLMQARMPTEASRAIRTMENLGNPFAAQADRKDFVKEMGLRVIEAGEEVDVLLWIGCATVFDPAKHKIVKDLMELLDRAGVDYGVLGEDEKCCGDPARLLGEENLFQTMAKEQVEYLNARKFNTLLVTCPHGFNVFQNEYPQFGGNYNVKHHSQYLKELLDAGKFGPQTGVAGTHVYHDPCYLGRWMGEFEAPRNVLDSIPSMERKEMAEHHERSFCCGAGGGHFWMDLKGPDRINNIRVRQAQDQKADTIVTGCAFCMQMMDDSVKDLDLEESMKVKDIASVLLASLPPRPESPKAEDNA